MTAPLDERIRQLEAELRELRRQQLRQRLRVDTDPVPLVTFSLGDQTMGVYLPCVLEVIRMVRLSPLPGVGPSIAGLLNLRGNILPVLDLRRAVGLPEKPYGTNTPIIVTEYENRRLGLIVDAVLDVISVSRDELQEPQDNLPWVDFLLFIAHLDDSKHVLIVDHSCLLSVEEERSLEAAVAP